MNTLTSFLTESELELIKEANAADKINTFFYNNSECVDLMKQYKESFDRFHFVGIKINNKRKLTKTLVRFNNNHCHIIPNRKRLTSSITEGKIVVDLTKTYQGRTFDESTRINDDNTISIWINTGEKSTTHLYNSDEIFISDEE